MIIRREHTCPPDPTLPRDEIVLGRCLDLLQRLPDGSVDLVVSSPPYNLGKEYEAKKALAHYLGEQAEVLRHCARVLRRSGSIFWQVGAFADDGVLIPLDVRIFPILEQCGLIPRNRIVWVRQHGLHGTKKFSCRHESILWFTKSDAYKFNLDSIRVPQKYQDKKAWTGEKKGMLTCNPNGKNPGDIWLFRNVKHNHEEQTAHPCQFPEDMISRIVLCATDPGDLVLDPFMGSGTVAVVARDHNRNYIGTEADPKYHSIAMRRLTGKPDASGCFPNLKTLRDYCERTGAPIDKYRFDVQVGSHATDRTKSRIYSEVHHLEELERRLSYEEGAFAADLRGKPRPVDESRSGLKLRVRKARTARATAASLFDREKRS